MESNWYFNDNLLYKDEEIFLILPSIIKKILVLDHSVAILLMRSSVFGDQNVFCYDFNKQLKWQIEKPHQLYNENHFTGIYLNDNKLYAYSMNGGEYHVDKELGKLLESELVK